MRHDAERIRLERPAAIGVLLATALVIPPTLHGQETTSSSVQIPLTPTPAAGQPEALGTSVAISGDTAIIGAAGAAFVLERNAAGKWMQVARIDSSVDPLMHGAGECGRSVAISGDTAMIGCPEASVPPDFVEEGTVFVLDRNQGGPNAWGVVAKLTGADRTFAFGKSIALGDEVAIIGAPEDDDLGNTSGSAYVFARTAGGAWTQVSKLTAADGDAADVFGTSIAMSGGTVIIGAKRDDERSENAGAAYVFERESSNPATWRQVQKLLASDGADANFGLAVAIEGDTALVLALHAGGSQGGAAYVFDRGDACGGWCEVARLPVPGVTTDIWFNPSAAIAGDLLIVGAPHERVDSGVTYVFSRTASGPGAHGEVARLTALDGTVGDNFGSAVAASGDTVILGAASIFNAGSGKAYACRVDPVILLEGCRRAEESILIWDPRVRQQSIGYVCCENEELVLTVTFGVGALIRNPFFEVSELTGGNALKNADGGPGGVGARLTVDVGDDGLVNGETLTVTFVVGLATRERFAFFVHLKGESGF